MSELSHRARAAQARAAKRWYVYLILCRSGAVYTGIARDVAVRYAQHVAGAGARYTRANPPRRLLVKFACLNQSEASRMEAATKKLTAINKRQLVGKTGAAVRRMLFGWRLLCAQLHREPERDDPVERPQRTPAVRPARGSGGHRPEADILPAY